MFATGKRDQPGDKRLNAGSDWSSSRASSIRRIRYLSLPARQRESDMTGRHDPCDRSRLRLPRSLQGKVTERVFASDQVISCQMLRLTIRRY